jgi:DNA-3-methyladenine glycosylase
MERAFASQAGCAAGARRFVKFDIPAALKGRVGLRRGVSKTKAVVEAFFEKDVVSLAKSLVGCELFLDGVGGRIVETEAYDASDPASHSFNGPTTRNAAMFGPSGRAYVYRIYGMHWCLNVVGGERPGAAALIRALEPTAGLEKMKSRRGPMDDRRLCSGPGRLCQALGVTGFENGQPLTAPPFELVGFSSTVDLVTGPRIGIRKAQDRPWRFGLRGSAYLSRPFSNAS